MEFSTRHEPHRVVVEPRARAADCAIIWLHGLGADGHDFEPIVGELDLPQTIAPRFVFPHAPRRPVTLNGGYVMRAWFDLYSLDRLEHEDEAGIRAAASALDGWVGEQANAGIDTRRIVLAGFSQGGAIALHAGLRAARPLAGVLALSTYLPLAHALAGELSAAGRTVPLFLAHGRHDPVVPLALAEQAAGLLDRLRPPVALRHYDMAHSVSAPELDDISAFLAEVLAPAGTA